MIVPVADVSKYSPPPRGASVFNVHCHGNGCSCPTPNKMNGPSLTTESLVTVPEADAGQRFETVSSQLSRWTNVTNLNIAGVRYKGVFGC